MFLFQTRLIYFPQKEISITPEAVGLLFEDIYFTAEDGVTLNGWFIPSDSTNGVILYCHGNAGNISHRLDTIKLFNDIGMSVFIFDYRGYGRSGGSPSEKGTYMDTEGAWKYLTISRNIDPLRIIAFGRSLGGAAAVNLASERPVGGIIVESSFTSIVDLGAEIYPFLPVRLLSRFKYNTLETIGEVQCPKLIIHSRDDELVPFRHGERIYESAGNPKEFLEISGTHNEGFLFNSQEYKARLSLYISRILGH